MRHIIHEAILADNILKMGDLGIIYYPLKTNSNIELVDKLLQLGVRNFLVSNTKQYNTIRNKGNIGITSINTLESTEILLDRYNNGEMSFVFDSIVKLREFIAQIKPENIPELEITIKLSISDTANIPVNTGASRQEQDKLEKYIRYLGCKYGYSIYINKEAKKNKDIADYIKIVLNSVRYGKGEFISIGGIEDLGNKEYTNKLKNISDEVTKLGKEFRIEPGEYLLDGAIDTYFNIINIHSENNYKALTIDGSIYNEFFDQTVLGKSYRFENIHTNYGIIQLNINRISDKDTEIHIFGDSSDSCDYLGKFYISEELNTWINRESKVLVKNTGAYFSHY